MSDTTGRFYVKIRDLKAGDVVQVDGDFTCIEPWEQCTIKADDVGNLYIDCVEGRHYLDGQEEGDYYLGLYKP